MGGSGQIGQTAPGLGSFTSILIWVRVMKDWFYTLKWVLCWTISIRYWYVLRRAQGEGLKTETTPTYWKRQTQR